MVVGNAQPVVEICRALEGLPLAIELAAARIKSMDPAGILIRIRESLSVLAVETRDLPTRQRTLWGAIDWSYRLLDEEERALFRRLVVFRSGWSIESAREVCAAEGWPASAVRYGLMSLVAKNLVRQEAGVDGKVRFSMLEAIREYALEQLRKAGDESDARWQAARYFSRMAEQARTELEGPDQITLLRQLEVEHPNLRSVLGWCIEQARDEEHRGEGLEIAVSICNGIYIFWEISGNAREGLDWLDMMLVLQEAEEDPTESQLFLHARSLNVAGNLARVLSNYNLARRYTEEAIQVLQALGNERASAVVLNSLGAIIYNQGDPEGARALYEQSLEVMRRLDDKPHLANVLNNLGAVAEAQGNYEVARRYYEESLSLERELENERGAALTIQNLGQLAIGMGDYASAYKLFDEANKLLHALGDTKNVAYGLRFMASSLTAQGDYEGAKRLYRESIEIYVKLNDPNEHGIANALRGLAEVEAKLNHPRKAASLYSAGVALGETNDSSQADESLRQTLDSVRAELGEDDWREIWEKGQSMVLGDAVVLALGSKELSDAKAAPAQVYSR